MKTIIQTATKDLQDSIAYYKKLGFQPIADQLPNYFSDGQVVIHINSERTARAGVVLYKEDWQSAVDQLQTLTNMMNLSDGYLLGAPSGTWIYLYEKETPINHDLGTLRPSLLGNYAGLSLESTDIEKSIAIWKAVGFTRSSGSIDQGWVSVTNEQGYIISLMLPLNCPHLFFNPSLTYFNGKNNLALIDKIKQTGVPIAEEVTHFNPEGIVDNIILRDSGGLGAFIFND